MLRVPKKGTCKYQQDCKFIHINDGQDQAGSRNERSMPRKHTGLPNSERTFRARKDNIPQCGMNSPLSAMGTRPLGAKLASFFQEAQRLIDVDASVLQDVIQSLAGEGGLRCIQELQYLRSRPT